MYMHVRIHTCMYPNACTHTCMHAYVHVCACIIYLHVCTAYRKHAVPMHDAHTSDSTCTVRRICMYCQTYVHHAHTSHVQYVQYVCIMHVRAHTRAHTRAVHAHKLK